MSPYPASAYYIYGFTRAAIAPEANLGVGVNEQHAPILWTRGEISVVLSLVAPEDFCDAAGEENMRNLDWLGPRACRHQAVIEQVMRSGPVLPARFGTLFSSLEQLEKFLSANAPAIVRFLDRTDGRDEWAVKGFLCQADAEAPMLARLRLREGEPESMSPGAAYLWEQRLKIKARGALADWLTEVSDELLRNLGALAPESRQRPNLPRDTTEARGEMILNWAFLVSPPALTNFRAQIERANVGQNADGLAFELSGPWPPYSFVPTLASAVPPEAMGSV